MESGKAVEMIGGDSRVEPEDGTERPNSNDMMQICELVIETHGDYQVAIMLLQYVNGDQRSFPVVHRKTMVGRELQGDADECGARAAHIAVRLPVEGISDTGAYRCVVEHVDGIRRRDIELLFRRQLRTWAKESDLQFSVSIPRKRTPLVKAYKYYPRFTLLADVGRQMKGGGLLLENLSQMVFTKRAEKQMTADKTSIIHQDVIGDVEVRIPASQAPKDLNERLKWLGEVQTWFKTNGWSARLYYRHGKRGQLSGTVDKAVEGAMDLLMYPKQIVELSAEPRIWRSASDRETVDQMIGLLNDDSLWERTK